MNYNIVPDSKKIRESQISFLKKISIGGGLMIDNDKNVGNRKISEKNRQELLSFLRIKLREKNLFLKVDNVARLLDRFFNQIMIIFDFSNNVDKELVLEILEEAYAEVSKYYYFSRALNKVFESLKSGKRKDELSRIIHEFIGAKLSDDDINWAIIFGSSDYYNAKKHKKL